MGSYKKKLFIVLLLFLLISCFVCSSVNATTIYQDDNTYKVDVVSYLKEEQEILSRLFLLKYDTYGSDSQKNTLRNFINNYPYYYTCYFTFNITQQGYKTISCYFIPNNINWKDLSIDATLITRDVFYDPNITFPVSGYNISYEEANVANFAMFRVNLNNNTVSTGTTTETIFLPSFLIYYYNQNVINYGNGYTPTMNLWGMIKDSIDNNTASQDETTQAVNNLRNDFNAEESDEDYDFPTDNPTNDPTSSGIDNIFNMFYMRINSWNALGINVPIPFTGKSFTINPDITENIINGWTPSTQIATVFKTLLSGVWYYLLGRYIVKDVQHYVDGLQTGDILTKSDTNIKTEML